MTARMSQAEAVAATPLAAGERVAFFLARRFPDLDCLTATFTTHAYAPHTHDTYVIGAIEAGCEMWHARGRRHYASAGDLAFNNPLDVHDGIPYAGGYAYRMTYPTVDLMRLVAGAITGRIVTTTPFFRDPVVRDPTGAALFCDAHRTLQAGGDALEGEELLFRAYARFLVLHADLSEVRLGTEVGSIKRARGMIEERYAEDLTLTELAETAGLSHHHLIRAFRREVGLTPHAYLIDVRVRRALDRLKAGEAPADVAAAVGFADQPHLTRAFKARLGVTPGAYRRAAIG